MLLEATCAASCALIVYHHAVYPLALRALARRVAPGELRHAGARSPGRVTLIIPAFNEARTIGEKIRNCAALDVPHSGLEVLIGCDGCTDATVGEARAAIAALGPTDIVFELVEFAENRGKVAVLNDLIARAATPLVALTDASAMLSANAVARAASHFVHEDVGFVTGAYEVGSRDQGVNDYWSYQKAIKRAEAALGAPVGAHGAFYMFRRSEWRPLEPDTINDDVILPMRIVERGYRGVYDETIVIDEADKDTVTVDLRRRRRLAAGAVQQAIRLAGLASPSHRGVAFSFVSGKALRAFMPFIMVCALATNVALAPGSPAWSWLLACQLVIYEVGALGLASRRLRRFRPVAAVSYLVAGHANGLAGALMYFAGKFSKPWTREKMQMEQDIFMPRAVLAGKRALDIAIASVAFIAFAILFVPIALAIKLESRGPVFYRQLRVGLRTPTQSRLFHLTKFRTMRADAESRSGAVWATKNDPRITRVGNFLRKTRLDELPQCLDVLRGDMSVVGPRPERPQFFEKLETNIPFYVERTFGLKPGITGLAQVTLPYDSSIEDVRAKVLYDHAYAMQLTTPGKWLLADISIILRTFTVMVLGKGQ